MMTFFKPLWKILPVCLMAFSFFALPVHANELEKADLVVVHKARRSLELWAGGETIAKYRIALGFNPVGHKEYEGDGKTPEGVYTITTRNERSNFYRSLKINYPNATDEMNAAAKGQKPGGMIMIHGIKNGMTAAEMQHPKKDWTEGCIAVTDAEIDDIWQRVDSGTAVLIMP
jgi:murein L,D-transpeptidase YafK